MACGAGKYAASPSSSTCLDCGAGKYLASEGGDEEADCVLCGAGKYSTTLGATGAATCLDCEAGKYSQTVGADTNVRVCPVCGGMQSWHVSEQLLCELRGFGVHKMHSGCRILLRSAIVLR